MIEVGGESGENRTGCYRSRILNGEALGCLEPFREILRRRRFHPFPNRSEALKRLPAVSGPIMRWWPTAARAIDAIQPHCSQSGFPPNWHGVMSVRRSAESIFVVRANMHSVGFLGGDSNSRMSSSGISRAGYFSRNFLRSSITAALCDLVSISGSCAPRCGVKMLNHTLSTSGWLVQKLRNSSR